MPFSLDDGLPSYLRGARTCVITKKPFSLDDGLPDYLRGSYSRHGSMSEQEPLAAGTPPTDDEEAPRTTTVAQRPIRRHLSRGWSMLSETSEEGVSERVQMKRQRSLLMRMVNEESLTPDAASVMEEPQAATMGTSEYVKLGLFFVLPGAIALIPVLLPFGNVFAKDGSNSIKDNWAYYFWYTPIGWGAMWVKVVLWNSELWDHDFFIPFMHCRPGVFLCNGTLVPVVNTVIFSTLLYLGGYMIFNNPVPLGTVSLGVPCFVFLFVNMYFFVVPKEDKQTVADHVRIIRCWLPFVFWVVNMFINMILVWVQTYLVCQLENHFYFLLGNLGVQVLFIAVRELFTRLPLDLFLGWRQPDLALLWVIGYSAIYSTMSDWIFPGMPLHLGGILSTVGVVVLNTALNFEEFRHASDVPTIITTFMNATCDAVSSLAFLIVFTYNCFGPNQHYIYMTSEFTTRQKVEAIVMICCSFSVNMVKLLILLYLGRKRYSEELQKDLMTFTLAALGRWYWLVIWLLVSTCCACGACMVMMHDGMDFSFMFTQWNGTWPFV